MFNALELLIFEPNFTGGFTPFRPLNGLQRIPVAWVGKIPWRRAWHAAVHGGHRVISVENRGLQLNSKLLYLLIILLSFFFFFFFGNLL